MAKQKPDIFSQFTSRTAIILGHAWAFVTALLILIAWGLAGPIFGFSDTWQLVINTSTTIVTFLMVFIIQNTQNRDNLAMNIKLDVLLREAGITKEDLLDAEEQSDAVLQRERQELNHGRGLSKQQRSKQSDGE